MNDKRPHQNIPPQEDTASETLENRGWEGLAEWTGGLPPEEIEPLAGAHDLEPVYPRADLHAAVTEVGRQYLRLTAGLTVEQIVRALMAKSLHELAAVGRAALLPALAPPPLLTTEAVAHAAAARSEDPGMSEATRICARLLREGSVPRAALPDLDCPDVRQEVERRLGGVGLVLATSAYSEHVGIRLSPEITADTAFDAATNLGLRSDACALMVILWARLVLQKRTAAETRELPGRFPPRVRLEALVRELRPVLGGRSRIRSLVTQLRRLGFLAGYGEQIEAGPLLELAIDGERMVAFLRREVLAKLVAEREGKPAAEEDGEARGQRTLDALEALGGRAVEAIAQLGGSAAMGDLARLTNAPASRLRRVLRDLEAAGRVRRTGERASARYHLVVPID